MAINTKPIEEMGKYSGEAAKSSFGYAADTVSNIFNKDVENQMLVNRMMGQQVMTQNVQNQMDPNRRAEQAKLSAWGLGPQNNQSFSVPTSQPTQTSINSESSGGSSSFPPNQSNSVDNSSGSNLMAKSATSPTGMSFEDPKFSAMQEKAKNVLQADANFHQLKNMAFNYAANLKSAYIQQGGNAGLGAGGVGSFLAATKQPNTAYISGLGNLKMDMSAALARQLQGTSQGIQRMFTVTSHNIPDNITQPDAAGSIITDMLTNAYAISEGIKQSGMSDKQLSQMSDAQLKNLGEQFKQGLDPNVMQAIRDKVGEGMGQTGPAQTYNITGEKNPIKPNPFIKDIFGENKSMIQKLTKGGRKYTVIQ
jgi:hypothetical protein